MVVGTLRGFDQFMNLVVDDTVEVNGNDKIKIGMVVSIFSWIFLNLCFNYCLCSYFVAFLIHPSLHVVFL